MSFATVWKSALQLLIQQAEAELGGGKGAEKKAWVLAQLRAALTALKWPGVAVELAVGVSSVLIEFLIKEALELLGKQS